MKKDKNLTEAYLALKYCGDTFEAYGNKTRKFCSHEHYIKFRFYEGEKNAV